MNIFKNIFYARMQNHYCVKYFRKVIRKRFVMNDIRIYFY